MIPYNIIFLLGTDEKELFSFQSNEKPFKGEIYSILDSDGKAWKAKVTDVLKTITRHGQKETKLVYRCKVEKHEATPPVIGFGKRN